MSLLSILSEVDWLSKAEKGATVAEALLPLLIKTALDGAKIGSDPGAILRLITDIETDISTFEAAFKTNNVEVQGGSQP